MPPEIAQLIDHPTSLVLLLFVGAFAGMSVERFRAIQRRAAWRRDWRERGGQGRGGSVVPFAPRADRLPPKVPDAADQLRTVMGAEFKAQPLLNRFE